MLGDNSRGTPCRTAEGSIVGAQSLKGKLPLRIAVPMLRIRMVSSRASSQHDDGEAHAVLARAHAQHRGDRSWRKLLLQYDFGK